MSQELLESIENLENTPKFFEIDQKIPICSENFLGSLYFCKVQKIEITFYITRFFKYFLYYLNFLLKHFQNIFLKVPVLEVLPRSNYSYIFNQIRPDNSLQTAGMDE